jgi:protein-tyrosine phosphatase
VVRSDSPAALTPAGRLALLDYRVRAIVDLRLPGEVAAHPNPFAEPDTHGVAYTNVSFLDPAAPPPEDDDDIRLADDYKGMLDRFRGPVAAAMAAIANAPEGGVLIHCAAGKDRTGLIAALLLGLVGVAPETIAADYALTAECLRPRNEAWLENGPGDRDERAALLARFAPTAEVMLEVLDRLEDRYGGVEGYLRAAGVAPEDVARLRARLVAPAAG